MTQPGQEQEHLAAESAKAKVTSTSSLSNDSTAGLSNRSISSTKTSPSTSTRNVTQGGEGSSRDLVPQPTDELRPTPNKQGVRDMELVSRLQWAGPLGTLDSIIKAQRRIKGVIVSLEGSPTAACPEGGATSGGTSCRIASEYGEFPFNMAAIKANKRFPERLPRPKDRCEFKVSQTNPPKATSIRIAIPSSEVAAGDKAPGPVSGSKAIGVTAGAGGLAPGSSLGGESNASSMMSAGETGYSFLTGYSASTPGTSQRELGGSAGQGGGTGLDDLCLGLQGMSPSYGSNADQ